MNRPYREYDPNRLFDTLLRRLDLCDDDALSRKLRLSPSVVLDLRSGRRPVEMSMLMAWSQCTGVGIVELRRILGDRRSSGRMKCIFLWTEPGTASNEPLDSALSTADLLAPGRTQP